MTPKKTIMKKDGKLKISFMDGPYHMGMSLMDDPQLKMTDLLITMQLQ